MKITLEQLFQKVKEANPTWVISSPPRGEGGDDGTLCHIDNDRIDVWRFGDWDEHEMRKQKVLALATYICTAATMLPRLEAALRNLHDRKLIADPDGDHMQEVEELLKELNEIEL